MAWRTAREGTPPKRDCNICNSEKARKKPKQVGKVCDARLQPSKPDTTCQFRPAPFTKCYRILQNPLKFIVTGEIRPLFIPVQTRLDSQKRETCRCWPQKDDFFEFSGNKN